MESTPASHQPSLHSGRSAPHPRWLAAGVAAVAGFCLFQFYGNASRGYIATDSLFYWWGFQWVNPASETQHGWMILALSGWVLWRNLTEVEGRKAVSARGAGQETLFPAVAALMAGLALHVVGFVAQQARISVLALLLFTWGVLRLGGGKRWGRAAMFPLVFLGFALPLGVLDSLGFGLWLRLRVVEASAWIAHTAGIAVLRSGTQLVAPDGTYHYDVAAACSGIRSLAAITALSLLAGYLSFTSWRRRALVLLLCFPLVYLGNVARIVAIIFAAELGGPAWGDRAHEVMGYGVFAIVFAGVLGGIRLIQRRWPESGGRGDAPPQPTAALGMARSPFGVFGGNGSSPRAVWMVAAGVAVLAGFGMTFLSTMTQSGASGRVGVRLTEDEVNPVELPGFIGTEWIGRRTNVTTIERELLPADTGYSRRSYVAIADPRQQVFLSIVLNGRDRTSIHRPELCLVGQGWTIQSQMNHQFEYPSSPPDSFPATVLRVERELQSGSGRTIVPQLTAYWFVGADRVVASHWEMLFRDAWQRITQGRADRWAYVLMQTDAKDGEAAAFARMQAVLEATLPVFQKRFAADNLSTSLP